MKSGYILADGHLKPVTTVVYGGQWWYCTLQTTEILSRLKQCPLQLIYTVIGVIFVHVVNW
jgi:hypothetical protein